VANIHIIHWVNSIFGVQADSLVVLIVLCRMLLEVEALNGCVPFYSKGMIRMYRLLSFLDDVILPIILDSSSPLLQLLHLLLIIIIFHILIYFIICFIFFIFLFIIIFIHLFIF
jgi:hypothetical protein